jgi:LysM repeat protein
MALVMLMFPEGKTVKTLNPFSGPGSLKEERQQNRREQFKTMVWAIVAANVVLFVGLLIQGCRQEPPAVETSRGTAAQAAPCDTNGVAAAAAQPDTNSPVAMAPAAAPTNTLPDTAPTVAPIPVQTAAKQYTVVKGDSFYKIVKANGITIKALTDANPGVDSAKLKVGQGLQLPAAAEPATAVSARPTAPASALAAPTGQAPTRYVVKSGDSLSRIARTHGTTVQALKAANGLTSDRVVAGQSLKLPETKTAGTAATQG